MSKAVMQQALEFCEVLSAYELTPMMTDSLGDITAALEQALAEPAAYSAAPTPRKPDVPEAGFGESREPVPLNPDDVLVEVIAQTPGGFLPRTPTGVSLTHKPTGIVVVETEDRNPYRNREVAWEKLTRQVAFKQATTTPRKPVEPVYGDVLPAVGSTVWIRHGRDTDAHACTVTGYYVWNDLGGNENLHRVFVRLVYAGTDREQVRMLKDCFATKEAALAHGITGEGA